ncbi:hypothetical protein B566_EDAN004635 [Ephemera danica]|nr:hypothetical protein B566_EDAN004635 [Ephemera danica]
MIKKLRTFGTYSLGFSLFQKDFDHAPENSKYTQTVFGPDENETGRDRLYMMFSTDEFGNTSPEVVSVLQAGMLGLFTGGCIGGFIHSRNAYLNFMETNQATAFTSHLEAKKKLQDKVTINFGKGAFKWGWRLGLFSSSYVLITTSIAVYRGKSGIIEYVTAGGLTGATYKSSLGFRGVLVGGILGSVLGGLAGAISLGILRLTGTTMEEVRYWQYQWKTSRDNVKRQAMKEWKEQDEDPFLLKKDKTLPKTITLDTIPDEKENKTS